MPAKPNDPKPVKFRQIFAEGRRIYALDLAGNLWVANVEVNGYTLPVDILRWFRCAMPADQ